MTFGRRWIGAAAVLPLLLAACSGDPEPTFSPPSVSPSVSETPAPTADPAPEPWEKKSEAGAVAFARHWVDVFNEATGSGDTGALDGISGSGCGSCSRFADVIEGVYSDGGSIESNGWRVLDAVPSPDMPPTEPTIAMRLRQTPQEVHQGDGETERFPGGKVTYSARLHWSGDGWAMGDLVLLQ